MIIEILAVALFAWGLHQHYELRRIRLTDKSSYVFKYPRKPSPTWTYSDDTLARLVYDYHLPDSEVERLVKDGLHDAALQYRKEHPFPSAPPSDDLYETIFPYE